MRHVSWWVRLVLLSAVISVMFGCSDDDDDPFRADVNGQWDLVLFSNGVGGEPEFIEITQDGGDLTFRRLKNGFRPQSGTGTVAGADITLNAAGDQFMPGIDLSGFVESGDQSMSGTWADTDGNTGDWEANRATSEPVVLINLGDSLTNGMQSNVINQVTQVHAYPQKLAEQFRMAERLFWTNPLFSPLLIRNDATLLPYNLGVGGATVQSLITDRTGSGNPLIDAVLSPIPEMAGGPVSPLEAAEYLAGLYPNRLKLMTLLIGANDVLGAVLAGDGTQMTEAAITAFLSDTAAGHELDMVTANLSQIVNRLLAFPNTYVMVGTVPSVTENAFLLGERSLEAMATFDGADVTVLAPGEAVGFGPFVNLIAPEQSIARALTTNNLQLNATIAATVQASDGFSLDAGEKQLLDDRVDAINAHIRAIADGNDRVVLVDIDALFAAAGQGSLVIGGEMLLPVAGGGFFSLDGVHPGHTVYAEIANAFVRAVNATGLILNPVPEVDLATVYANDPYRDMDGDAYVPGPSDPAGADPLLLPLADCDDTDAGVVAPYINGAPCP